MKIALQEFTHTSIAHFSKKHIYLHMQKSMLQIYTLTDNQDPEAVEVPLLQTDDNHFDDPRHQASRYSRKIRKLVHKYSRNAYKKACAPERPKGPNSALIHGLQ